MFPFPFTGETIFFCVCVLLLPVILSLLMLLLVNKRTIMH